MVDDADSAGRPTDLPARRMRAIVFIPLVLFVALAAVFFSQIVSRMLHPGDPGAVPSALIGSPAPEFDLAALPDLSRNGAPVPGLSRQDLLGQVTLVNVWASWCPPCRAEHPTLMSLADDPRFRLVGIDLKDTAENARRFLGTLGNPFAAIGADVSGRTAIDWGVVGPPETFLVGRDGTVLFRWWGGLTPEIVENQLMPEIEKALAGA